MSNHLKKHRLSLGIRRLFTRGTFDAVDLIHFQEAARNEDGTPALECPDNWSPEAAELLAEHAACASIPAHTHTIEENTVPSWLWQRVAEGKGLNAENSAREIFDRVAGAATYSGWKQNLFADESEARSFYEETRYSLLQRFIVLEPATLATLGLDWVYGITQKPAAPKTTRAAHVVEISNATIDAVVGGSMDKAARGKWQKLFGAKKSVPPVTLHFSDIASDWEVGHERGTAAVLDLLAYRHNDGSINIEALRHAVRLAVTLLDLHEFTSFAIGFANLAPLLTALAIAYDSEAGRTMAAAIAAIVTAEAYATSAELAALRGASAEYNTHRETILRALRNHRRAAYGDRNDYEKMSVLPVPLGLDKCPDLTLAAAAQRRWDETLELVREHGLRATQVTALGSSPTLAVFMECGAQGIAPMQGLTAQHLHQREIAPHVSEGLARLGYDRATIRAIVTHAAGALTLEKAPAINHTALRARGCDAEAIERIEDYLRQVNDIRLAFTPWVVGMEFCRKNLKIEAAKLQNPAFNLLSHFGFNDATIAAANAYCYGHDTVKSAKDLRPKHTTIFARANEITADARIKMAAAVQSFVSGDVALDLALPAALPAEKSEKVLLGAWRQGLKSVNLSFEEGLTLPEFSAEKTAHAGKAKPVTKFLHTQKPALPARQSKLKALRHVVSQPGHASAKATHKGRTK